MPPNALPPRLPYPHRSSMKEMNAASTKTGYRMLSKARLRFVNDPDGSMNNGKEYFLFQIRSSTHSHII